MNIYKKSEFMGQIRVTPQEKAMIRAMLKFYNKTRGQMAYEVMNALFHHHERREPLTFPLRFKGKD